MNQEAFEHWAILELFGHQRIAGKVSEQTIGGCAFVRVDVPGDEELGIQPFTKLFGNGAIYAISITDEETARAMVKHCRLKPIDRWSIQDMIREKQGMLSAPDGEADPVELDE